MSSVSLTGSGAHGGYGPYGTYDRPEQYYDDSGISPVVDIVDLAYRFIAGYDRNGNGKLNLAKADGNDEVTRRTGGLDGSTTSIMKLAETADSHGNRDGWATANEIASILFLFDRDQSDGRALLSGDDLEAFTHQFGEEYHAGSYL